MGGFHIPTFDRQHCPYPGLSKLVKELLLIYLSSENLSAGVVKNG